MAKGKKGPVAELVAQMRELAEKAPEPDAVHEWLDRAERAEQMEAKRDEAMQLLAEVEGDLREAQARVRELEEAAGAADGLVGQVEALEARNLELVKELESAGVSPKLRFPTELELVKELESAGVSPKLRFPTELELLRGVAQAVAQGPAAPRAVMAYLTPLLEGYRAVGIGRHGIMG